MKKTVVRGKRHTGRLLFKQRNVGLLRSVLYTVTKPRQNMAA